MTRPDRRACPDWHLSETDEELPHVVRGLADFHRFIIKNAQRYILNSGDIQQWHGKIFKDVVPLPYYAGNFRCASPRYPCLQSDVQVGGAVGAPFKDVPNLMKEFSGELATRVGETDEFVAKQPSPVDRARAAVQLAALSSGRFLQIHPFLNGNGRMSRLLANFFLYRYGYPLPFYEAFPRPGPEYERACAECMRGNFNDLYRYLLSVTAGRLIRP